MAEPPIPPALSPEQWANVDCLNDDDLGAHAYAAVLLYRQPFGFTHEDVADAEWAERACDDANDKAGAARFRSLASRLAALLPPTADDGTTP